MIRFVPPAALLLALSCIGCGAPQYAHDPTAISNRVKIHRGIFGGGVEVENGTDTDVAIEGMEYDPKTGGFTVEKVTFKSSNAETYKVLEPLMMAYRQQQEGYRTIRETEWSGFNTALSTVASVVGPVATGYIQSRTQMAAMDTGLRGAVVDVVGRIVTGEAPRNETLAMLKTLAPELHDAVEAKLPPVPPTPAP